MAENDIPPSRIEVGDRITLDDKDIARLRVTSEDHFVERKSFGDWRKDCVKTVVAFANSAPVGHPAFLFIGVKDNGEIEAKSENLDSIQKTLADSLKSIYPPVYWIAKAMTEADRSYLVVMVYGSESRPHFAGHSYIREGSQTRQASEQEFQRLIDIRSSITYELDQWLGKCISLERLSVYGNAGHVTCHLLDAVLTFVNRFYVTVRNSEGSFSYPLNQLTVSWDDKQSRLKLIVEQRAVARTVSSEFYGRSQKGE